MERVSLTTEGHRQRLRGLRWDKSAHPFLFTQWVLDSARRWLQLERPRPGADCGAGGTGAVHGGHADCHCGLAPVPPTGHAHRCNPPGRKSSGSKPQQAPSAQTRCPCRAFARPQPSNPVSRAHFHFPSPPFPDRESVVAAGFPPFPLSPSFSSPRGTPPSAGMQGPVCWRCGDLRHLQQDCPVMDIGAAEDASAAAPGPAPRYHVPSREETEENQTETTADLIPDTKPTS
ncbi:uncharacterized protein LOC114909210 isoform X2 [Scleropages formosus]|uniref:uncharacterized protein LOC114909210 isoform X2 n=1 Tax=Scleropages formosus TaxID=113540 RepID=UPI0010FAABAE|nr:uncharacterized protein LOC114909210 isoform X2 [Scleropages formosus]